jgi:oligosaccharide amylase
MSKSFVLGNGNILLCFDAYGQVKDFYFPYVGLENHVGGGFVHRLGVHTERGFAWLSDPSFEVSVGALGETMATEIVARSKKLAVEISFSDIVYNEKNIFVRRVIVKNTADTERTIKIFFNQQYQISETGYGNTAYFDPSSNAIVHYKGRRVFLVSGAADDRSFDDYSVGLLGVEGKEGTWRDAEDGTLSKNPIEHGSVDSTIAFTLRIAKGASAPLMYWTTVAETVDDARDLQRYLLRKTPEHLIKTTEDFWKIWVNKFNFTFEGLEPRLVTLFKRSLLIIRTHVDNHGAILASGDSDLLQYGHDTYSYMWPRDGAFVALSMAKSGYYDIAKRFFSFANDVISSEGYLMHKYQSDKSLGSSWHPWVKDGKRQLAIQEDETALVIYALWEYYDITKDLEFVEDIYNSLIKKAADFLVSYREPSTGLPGASWDLWEEKYGISTFTASAVYGALVAAARFAKILGKEDDESVFSREAKVIRTAILEHLYDSKAKYFYKHVNVRDGVVEADTTIDASSFYGIFKFGILLPEDPMLREAVWTAEREIKAPVGGIARYKNDYYYRSDESTPGNPWIVTTLWLAEYYIALAKHVEDFSIVKEKLTWVADRAFPSGILAEQFHPRTGAPLSVAPLTWSHAAYALVITLYLQRLEQLGISPACYPIQ